MDNAGRAARNSFDLTNFQTLNQRDIKNKQKGTASMSIMNKRKVCSVITAAAMAAYVAVVPLYALESTADEDEGEEIYYELAASDSLPDPAELEEAYINKLFYGNGIALFKNYGTRGLTGASLEMYNQLKTAITEIAAGTRGSTEIKFSLTQSFSGSCNMADEVNKVVNILMADMPAEFYWYDKTAGYSLSGTVTKPNKIIFGVSTDYRGTPPQYTTVGGNKKLYYTVDSDKIASANIAVANAQQIVARYAGKSDYEKIVGFRNEICSLVSYNTDAASKQPSAIGINPWQLVYVFDGDTSTNVVCEGYSKAFQYLCDCSGIECYTVTGNAGGGHMWNIVTLDSENYLVDITNCDDGENGSVGIGYPDKLLLAGSESATATGLTVNNLLGGRSLTYTYDSDTLKSYPSDILTISKSNYVQFFVSPKTLTLGTGRSEDVTISYDGTTPITYTVSPADSVTVEPKSGAAGKYTVTANKKGTAEVTFTLGDTGKKTVCTVEVTCDHQYSSGYEKDETGHWQICTKCSEKSPVSDHDMEEAPDTAKPATCKEDGREADKKCTVCGYEVTGAIISKDTAAHTPKEAVRENEIAATCTKEGSYDEVVYCGVCGKEISRTAKTAEKLPHTEGTPVHENEIAPTCTKDGSYDEVTKCTVCGEIIKTEHKTTPSTGHSLIIGWQSDETSHWQECSNCAEKIGLSRHTEDSGKVTTAATATEDGIRTYSCTVCGKVLRTEVVPALGESHIHGYTIINSDSANHWNECICGEIDINTVKAHTLVTVDEIAAEPTCNTDGLKYVVTKCSECGREISRVSEAIHKTGTHTAGTAYSSDSTGHWKTCTSCGTVIDKETHTPGPAATESAPQTCTVCGYVIAPALTHTHTFSTEWSGDDAYHWHNATCQHTGEVNERAVHTWDSGIVTKEPTETEKGVKTFTCTVCGRTKTEEISVLAHTHSTSADWSFDSTGHWHSCSGCDEKIDFNSHASASEITKAPTATETGTRRYFCTVCGYEIRTETIPATGYTPSRPSTPSVPAVPSGPSSPSFNDNAASASGGNQSSRAPREPSLSNGSGKTGWDSVVSDIEAAPAGGTVTVNMNGTVQLPTDVINGIAGKDVDLVLKMNNKITWRINGSSVTYAKNITKNVNMRAALNAGKIPAREIKKISRGNKVVRLSLAHKGKFGFDAEMTVTLGKKYSGKYANLMCYDPADKSFELVDASLIKNGKTNLKFGHGADYVIIISKTPFEADEDTSD